VQGINLGTGTVVNYRADTLLMESRIYIVKEVKVGVGFGNSGGQFSIRTRSVQKEYRYP